MSDDIRLRAAQRAGDDVGVLVWRVRTGEVPEDRVRIAASLGEPRAIAIMPETKQTWTSPSIHGCEQVVSLVRKIGRMVWNDERGLVTAFGADCVEHAAIRWMRERKDDRRPVFVIADARRWVATRSESERNSTLAAGRECLRRYHDQRSDSAPYTDDILGALCGLTDTVRRQTAQSPEGRLLIERGLAQALRMSIQALAQPDMDFEPGSPGRLEHAWQRQRLAQYALGEVQNPRQSRP